MNKSDNSEPTKILDIHNQNGHRDYVVETNGGSYTYLDIGDDGTVDKIITPNGQEFAVDRTTSKDWQKNFDKIRQMAKAEKEPAE